MKKIVICLLVIAMLALCLAGCRDDKNETETQSSSDPITESVTDKTEQTEQTGQTEQTELTEEDPQTGAEEETNQEEENTESQQPIEEDDEDAVIVVPDEGTAVGGEDLD